MTRATVHRNARRNRAHPERSNKYSASDHDERPTRGSRSRVWVGGYARGDGTHVRGHYRAATH
ncbi:MAG TPA: hypothetical protein VGH28_20200 [Polyangiaceae bacterium]